MIRKLSTFYIHVMVFLKQHESRRNHGLVELEISLLK